MANVCVQVKIFDENPIAVCRWKCTENVLQHEYQINIYSNLGRQYRRKGLIWVSSNRKRYDIPFMVFVSEGIVKLCQCYGYNANVTFPITLPKLPPIFIGL